MSIAKKEFYVVIEKDEDGNYIGEVPQLKACYSQGETVDELMSNMKEVIELCLEEESEESTSEFVGIQKIKFSLQGDYVTRSRPITYI